MDSNRVVLDCRNKPEAKGCTLTFAGTEQEVLDIAEIHAASKHGMKKEDGLREKLKGMLKPEKVEALSH
jgi:predicted small metal-binding protein